LTAPCVFLTRGCNQNHPDVFTLGVAQQADQLAALAWCKPHDHRVGQTLVVADALLTAVRDDGDDSEHVPFAIA
jgi:hypothetical protein